jgi:hypothetical protein
VIRREPEPEIVQKPEAEEETEIVQTPENEQEIEIVQEHETEQETEIRQKPETEQEIDIVQEHEIKQEHEIEQEPPFAFEAPLPGEEPAPENAVKAIVKPHRAPPKPEPEPEPEPEKPKALRQRKRRRVITQPKPQGPLQPRKETPHEQGTDEARPVCQEPPSAWTATVSMVQAGDESVNEGEVPDSHAVQSAHESDPIRELAEDREGRDSVRDGTVPSDDAANGGGSELDVEHPIGPGSGTGVGPHEVRIGETEAVTIESDQSVAREEKPTTDQGELAIEAAAPESVEPPDQKGAGD